MTIARRRNAGPVTFDQSATSQERSPVRDAVLVLVREAQRRVERGQPVGGLLDVAKELLASADHVRLGRAA